MEDFKRYLNENADDDERAAADLVKDGLAALRRKETVEAVSDLRQEWLKKRLKRRFWMLVVLIIFTGGAYWLLSQQKMQSNAQQQPSSGRQSPDSMAVQNTTTPDSGPGNLSDTPPEFMQAAEIMIRESQHNPPKFTDIQQQGVWNDILSNIAAGRPEETRKRLPELESFNKQEARWIQAILLVQAGERQNAVKALNDLASDASGTHRQAALRTRDLLTDRKPVQMAQNNAEHVEKNRFPAPNIRGISNPDPKWQGMLDRIWKTTYPLAALEIDAPLEKADSLLRMRNFSAAYVQLQKMERTDPANDRIRYLKGYCLLELGEGEEAMRYFDGLETRHPEWSAELDWYRGLGWLLAGDSAKARTQFQTIVRNKRHPFLSEAQNALHIIQ